MLRRLGQAQTRAQAVVDQALEWAVEVEDEIKVLDLLQGPHSHGEVEPSLSGVNKSFRTAVQHGAIEIVKFFFLEDSVHPDQYTVDEELLELAAVGEEVKLIELLQEHASAPMILIIQRRMAEQRKEGRRKLITPYLVDLTETKILLSIMDKQSAHTLRLTRPNTLVRNKLETIISDQRWINRTFCDSVDSHFKLVVVTLLECGKDDGTILRPDQTTINEAFISCVKRGYLSMAKMLLSTRSRFSYETAGADQNSFDQAFLAAMQVGNTDTIDWMLGGSGGFAPSQNAIDTVFTEQSQYVNMTRAMAGGARQLIRGRGRAQQNLMVPVIATVDQRLLLRSSVEARQAVERHQAGQVAQRRGNARMRMATEALDIHSFSGTSFAEDGPPLNDGVDENDGIDANNGAPLNIPIDAERHDDTIEQLNTLNLFEGGRRATAEANQHSQRRNVHDAVVRCIERRVGSQSLTTTQINQVMGDLIETNFPNITEQTRTMRVVSEGMTEENYRILGLVILFLRTFHRSSMSIWIHGFLSESISVNSCREGAMERMVTGLRGIEDEELQQIFRQAEGPNLARIFLVGSFNIYYSEGDERAKMLAQTRATQLALVLVDGGIGTESVEDGGAQVEERVLEILTRYAEDSIRSYGVDLAHFRNDIYQVVQAVCDGYDSFLLQYVRATLQSIEEKQDS